MRSAVIVFPGSNCDRDMWLALKACGTEVEYVWHADSELPPVDLIALPGGFSYGDYLRCGALAAKSPIMHEVIRQAKAGVHVLGVCNGFQILIEAGLLPGALMRNAHIHFSCKQVTLSPANYNTAFTQGLKNHPTIQIPIAHHDGNYYINEEGLAALEEGEQIAFRYTGPGQTMHANDNPNGSIQHIAGVFNAQKNVLGMMPHPERACDPLTGGEDGLPMLRGLVEALS